jgi:hypothetical protein
MFLCLPPSIHELVREPGGDHHTCIFLMSALVALLQYAIAIPVTGRGDL